MLTRAYRNLNKRDAVVYSLQTKQRNDKGKIVWKVSEYVNAITLQNCTLKHATPAALQRVRSGAREVCQYVQGERIYDSVEGVHLWCEYRRLIADPKRADGFCDAETGERIDSADFVKLNSDGAFYA